MSTATPIDVPYIWAARSDQIFVCRIATITQWDPLCGWSYVHDWAPPHGVEPLTRSIQARFDRCCHR